MNTHQHFDHIGGLRTYMHIGATIITHWKNFDFLHARRAELRAADAAARHGVALAADGAGRRAISTRASRENYVLSDGTRNMHMSYVQPLAACRRDVDGVSAEGEDPDRSRPFDTHEPLQRRRPPPTGPSTTTCASC